MAMPSPLLCVCKFYSADSGEGGILTCVGGINRVCYKTVVNLFGKGIGHVCILGSACYPHEMGQLPHKKRGKNKPESVFRGFVPYCGSARVGHAVSFDVALFYLTHEIFTRRPQADGVCFFTIYYSNGRELFFESA